MVKLDKHYTNTNFVDMVLKEFPTLNYDRYDTIVEPSAGSGAFSDTIPPYKRRAYDIAPDKDYIIEQDYLTFDDYSNFGKTLVIGNPPFGYRAQLAIEFFNKSAIYADVVAFVIPRSFRKAYLINQLNPNFHLVEDIDVNDDFHTDTKARCCFQIWERKKEKRHKIVLPKTCDDFLLVPQTKPFQPKPEYIAVRRTSHKVTNIGEIVTSPNTALPITQFIFVNPLIDRDTLIERLKSLDMSIPALNTVLSPTFTTGEMINSYNDKYIDNNNILGGFTC